MSFVTNRKNVSSQFDGKTMNWEQAYQFFGSDKFLNLSGSGKFKNLFRNAITIKIDLTEAESADPVWVKWVLSFPNNELSEMKRHGDAHPDTQLIVYIPDKLLRQVYTQNLGQFKALYRDYMD